jgi:hypothetical protein
MDSGKQKVLAFFGFMGVNSKKIANDTKTQNTFCANHTNAQTPNERMGLNSGFVFLLNAQKHKVDKLPNAQSGYFAKRKVVSRQF